MPCPECSVMDWSGVAQTTEHHPECGLAPFPDASARARMREAVSGVLPTGQINGAHSIAVQQYRTQSGAISERTKPKGRLVPIMDMHKPPALCKACNLPVGSGGCICVENPERKDKGYKIPFRSIEVKDRMLHFLSSDMRVDVDLTPIWSWLEEGGGFKTAFQGAHATPAGDASDLLVIERRNGGRIIFSPKIGAWSPPITGPELPATFTEALGLPKPAAFTERFLESRGWRKKGDGWACSDSELTHTMVAAVAFEEGRDQATRRGVNESGNWRDAADGVRWEKVSKVEDLARRIAERLGNDGSAVRTHVLGGCHCRYNYVNAASIIAEMLIRETELLSNPPEKSASTVLTNDGEVYGLTYYRYDGSVLFTEGDKVK